MKKMKKCKNGGYTAEGFFYDHLLSNVGMPVLEYGGNGQPAMNMPLSNLGIPLIPGGQYNTPQSTGNNSSQNGYYEQGGPLPYLMNQPMSNIGTPLIPMPPMMYGGDMDMMKKGGWIQGAVNPAHKGYCTPMTKSTCTPRRKAFAMTMKKHHGFHKKECGGPIMYADGGYSPTYLDDPNQEQEVPNAFTGPQQDYNPPTSIQQQEMGNMSMPGTAQENAPWRAGMTDEQAQQNIQTGTIPDAEIYTGNQPHRQQPFGTGFNNLLGAGMAAASFYENRRDQRNMGAYNRQQGMTGNVFAGQKLQPGSKGDYTANHGYFRPQQNTPTKAGMFYPMQQYGGLQHMDVGGGLLPVAYTADPSVPMQNTPVIMPPAPAQQNIQKFSGKGRKSDIAVDTNNPGNMKYSEWMASYQGQPSGIPGTDGGEFAAFPDVDHGLQAYKQQLFGDVDGTFKSRYYKKDTSVDKALKTWSNGAYGVDLYPALKGKTLRQLTPQQRDELVKRQIKRESPSMFQQLHQQGYYKMGGTYDMSEQDIQNMKNSGYDFDIID